MPNQISFNGTVIWDGATNGLGWRQILGSKVPEVLEKRSPQGEGYWLKPAGTQAAEHRLEMAWHATDKAALRAMIEGLMGTTRGDLVIPGEGTISNCRLSGVGEWQSRKSSGTSYIVENTLTFTEYP
jgi:hypothetical protein